MSELNFEIALIRLEEIVRKLEQGESSLDESLSLFEEGVKLARLCNKKLDDAEGKIEVMLEDERIEPIEVKD
ncbi:MAG: exodeoxyribonuclease VII small subunit [Bacillota bacterium]|nr:exodeoxyribonuclease VII small subunit [Bacillota bacterium]HHU60408.1 exodeoxyribonuclease VII small subunit [Natronincola sp.]